MKLVALVLILVANGNQATMDAYRGVSACPVYCNNREGGGLNWKCMWWMLELVVWQAQVNCDMFHLCLMSFFCDRPARRMSDKCCCQMPTHWEGSEQSILANWWVELAILERMSLNFVFVVRRSAIMEADSFVSGCLLKFEGALWSTVFLSIHPQ